MTDLQIAQLMAGLVVAATPWCVVRIALAVALRHAHSVELPLTRPAAVESLGRLTALVVPVIAFAAVWLPAPSLWMAAIDLTTFAAFSTIALRALGGIGDASRPACEASSPVRVASLQPRRLSDYVPRSWRIGLFGFAAIGLCLFTWRLMAPVPGRRLLLPIAFALFGPVFSWLYEVWLREVTTGGQTTEVADVESRRRRTVRAVFAVEVLLLLSYLVLAHALLDLDWVLHPSWGVAGTVTGGCLGVIGCALALSSDLARRRYRLV